MRVEPRISHTLFLRVRLQRAAQTKCLDLAQGGGPNTCNEHFFERKINISPYLQPKQTCDCHSRGLDRQELDDFVLAADDAKRRRRAVDVASCCVQLQAVFKI